MPLQKIEFCLICFFIFCHGFASAHDPLNSATITRFDDGAIEVLIRIEAGTAVRLLGLPAQTNRISSLRLFWAAADIDSAVRALARLDVRFDFHDCQFPFLENLMLVAHFQRF
jgi:hypothetical protein